jgi:hypothetical protein
MNDEVSKSIREMFAGFLKQDPTPEPLKPLLKPESLIPPFV